MAAEFSCVRWSRTDVNGGFSPSLTPLRLKQPERDLVVRRLGVRMFPPVDELARDRLHLAPSPASLTFVSELSDTSLVCFVLVFGHLPRPQGPSHTFVELLDAIFHVLASCVTGLRLAACWYRANKRICNLFGFLQCHLGA